ncbi:6029_t:CDS:10 [Entrophospora sp. SA101]|nr:6029_t:CDS:10 [Entrophospora sp. SA101]
MSETTLTKEELHEVLDLNRKYQAEIDNAILKIKAKIEKNKEIQQQIIHLKEHNNNSNVQKEHKESTIYSPPFFVDSNGNTPPMNATQDGKLRDFSFMQRHFKWNQAERDSLAKAIESQNMRLEALIAMGERRSFRDVLNINKNKLLYNVQNLDWQEISRQHVVTKNAEECLTQWTTRDHPYVNRSEWTAQEISNLYQIAKQKNNRNWQLIAAELGTNRTAAECFKQYNKQFLEPRKWTQDEDELLVRAQCLHRWTKRLNPTIRRGRWTEQDDQALKNAVQMYGPGNWVKIQQFVPSRTDVQCRERWVNVLSPDIKKDPWTAEEDEKLLQIVKEIGLGKWARVCMCMEGRTDNQKKAEANVKREAERANDRSHPIYPINLASASTLSQIINDVKYADNNEIIELADNEKESAEYQILQSRFQMITRSDDGVIIKQPSEDDVYQEYMSESSGQVNEI